MHSLPEIVRAIALNNKIDESRDFADMVQKSMVRRLATRNKLVRDLGVKQAPFVVLIGAGDAERARGDLVRHQQAGRRAAQDAGATASRSPSRCSMRSCGTSRSLKGVRAVASRESKRADTQYEFKVRVCEQALARIELSVESTSSYGVDDDGVTRSASESGTGSTSYLARSFLMPMRSAAEQRARGAGRRGA